MSTARSNHRLALAVRDVLRTTSPRGDVFASMAIALMCASTSVTVRAAELPTPCVAGSCGANIPGLVTSGAATATINGNTLNVNQTTNSAVLNWSQFNISADGIVNFQQPSAAATAVNRIHQNDPSRIFGSLNANGRVYLLNRNGVLFGDGAKVNVAGLVASSLDITPQALENGIAGASRSGPAFAEYTDEAGPLLSGHVRVERGATITTPEGGQVLMFAPGIVNEGTIKTPGGQTLLAAGSPIYLTTSTDPNLRGLLVEVGVGGTLTNGNAQENGAAQDPARLVGQIVAERGNVTLAGLAVNQHGRVTATTTVRENGSIRLQARDGGAADPSGNGSLSASNGGELTLGRRSVTEVTLSTDQTDTTVDANVQPRSQIQLQGHRVDILEDARVTATGGKIAITARANPGASLAQIISAQISGTTDDGSRIYVANGATLDVSGAEAELAMERNVVRAELRGDELADSPTQRDGALRGRAVFVDRRASGTRDDGTTWQGTSIADVSGQISLVERDVAERNLNGGTVSMESQGDTILAAGSTVDLSGGSIRYRDGYINTTQLLGSDGRIYDIADADPDRDYTGAFSGYSVRHERWGVTETFPTYGTGGRFESGYVEGKDAGTLRLVTPRAVLDGNVAAEVLIGTHQRAPSTAVASTQLYRPFDQLPLGAQLIFGREPAGETTDQVGGSVLFGAGSVLPTLLNDDGMLFDPRNDTALPSSLEATLLGSELFGTNRIARIEVHSNGRVDLPADVSLRLPQQGQLSIHAGQIELAGDVHAVSGDISATALPTETMQSDIGIDIRATAALDVSGQWVNDLPRVNVPGAQLAPLSIDGGVVTLNADQGSLRLEHGSVIDVSGGAWLQSNGSLVAGDAGSIALTASRDPLDQRLFPAVSLELGVQLSGYGQERGGFLSLSAPEICVADGEGCNSDSDGLLTLVPEDLLAGGFGSLTLLSNERGLTVTSGTDVNLRQRNRQLNSGAAAAASGTDLSAISAVGFLPDYLRAATDLSLQTSIAAPEAGYSNADFAAAPRLTIEAGALIQGDPGASIALRSNSALVVDGVISAPAGSIDLRVDNTLAIRESLDAQGLWLGANSRLDVAGVTRLQPNEFGFRVGDVLDGGSISLSAQRGAVIADPSSQINLAGTSAVLDIPNVPGSLVNVSPSLIASNGGLLSITAADAIILSGGIDAREGSGSAHAAGGRLSVALDANQRGASQQLVLPATERRVVVSQQATPVSVAPGTALPDAFAGRAYVAADDIEAAGFSDVRLVAGTTETIDALGAQTIAAGAIEFAGDTRMNIGGRLVLDAQRITGNGDVDLASAYLAVGHSSTLYQQTAATQARGVGALQLSGDFVELIGRSTIDGFDSVQLTSQGDLRLRGIQQSGASSVEGGLSTNANLTLQADQIYASTIGDFSLSLVGNSDGVLRIESTGQARSAVLSAGSHLTVSAPTIKQAGVLRAPFGTIDLNGEEVHLEAGSLTSTAAEGATILFGSTQAETDWVYSLSRLTQVVGDTRAVPEQRVLLDGERVQVDAGAVINVSGGGDLLAHEFIPGTTGTRDVLSALEEPDQYAIVPGLNVQYAPYDPQESANTKLSVGDSVHVSAGVNGLPEGDYVLLPARYALLPGAYLIKEADGFADLRAGQSVHRLDGATIVSGYRAVTGTNYRDARTSGFAIRPASLVAREARYATTLASEFFAARPEETGQSVPRLPQDAGVLGISAGAQLDIDGTLRAAAVEGGRGAALDISAENLRVSNDATAAEGEVIVDAQSLARLGAESILLGGLRSTASEGTAITANAQSVTIDAGTSLSAPEILIAARDTVRVEAQATLTAAGDVPVTDTFLLQGDGAFLRLAGGDQAAIRREGESGIAGTLALDEGARLVANTGSLALDASFDTQSRAELALQNSSLSLGASRINLGVAPDAAVGLILDSQQLSAMNLNELVLVSRSTIDLYGDAVLDVDRLALDAAGLQGLGEAGGSSITGSQSLVLMNSAGRIATDAAPTDRSLQINAGNVTLTDGTQRISGYDSVILNAAQSVIAEGRGGLSVAGDLNISTPRLAAATGANTSISAASALNLYSSAGPALANPSAGLGGALSLSGDVVQVATRIEAAAGSVAINAGTGDVTLADGAVIDVAGRGRDFDGVAVAAPAGEVRLVSQRGDIAALAGSRIDMSAVGQGEAGAMELIAVNGAVSLGGMLSGTAANAVDSGRVLIDAQTLGNLSELNIALNSGGVFAEREFRQRGTGDLVVAAGAGNTVRAERVLLTADQGGVIVNGVIDARGERGGSVVLAARDAITVDGSVLASAESETGEGGKVAMRAATGGVVLGSGSLIDVSAGEEANGSGGDVDIRVSRGAALKSLDVDSSNDELVLAGTISGARHTTAEAFRTYTDEDVQPILTDGLIDASVIDSLYVDTVDFMNYADGITAALGRSGDATFRLLPGIEIQTAGDLRLSDSSTSPVNWNLSTWRFGTTNAPGVLTLRAAGNLTFNGSLSDGFTAVTGAANSAAFRLAATPSDSWSYRLIAGADTTSANLMAVDDAVAAAGTSGNITIAEGPGTGNSPYRMVRTGNGSIDVAAAGDFILGNASSVLYTAGVASMDAVPIGSGTLGLGGRAYPTDGGDIHIDVRGDIEGAQSEQLVTDWLWRVGKSKSAAEVPGGFATAWTVNFARFQQNVAALGGGQVDISAAGNIRNFSASVPSIGKQTGGRTAQDSEVEVIGGGDLNVRAGGNIEGGSYYVGLGAGSLRADGDVTSSRYVRDGSNGGDPFDAELYPVLALGDGQWEVIARGDTGIETVINPTLLPQGKSQTQESSRSLFSTYAPSSAADLRSTAGDLTLSNDSSNLLSWLGNSINFEGSGEQVTLQTYAPTLRATALSGDLILSGNTTLFPAAGGTIELFAEQNVLRSVDPIVTLTLSDANPAALPSISAPQDDAASLIDLLSAATGLNPNLHAPTPVHAGDDAVSRIVARTGNVSFESETAGPDTLLYFATPARIVAGRDIVDLPLTTQHDDANDITSLIAGRDIRYTISRDATGTILGSSREINVDGPGTLQLAAARNIDLQTSAGISTRGNIANPNLPATGADISVLAGLNGLQPAYDATIARYFELGTGHETDLIAYVESRTGEDGLTMEQARDRFKQLAGYREALVAYVEQRSGRDDLSADEALALFRGYSRSEQRSLLEQTLFSELRFSGREAATTGSGDFARALTALETMFPASNPDTEAGEKNAYAGDIALYFSKIYALDGGNISLLAPGGELNVGLATPPASFGLGKSASDLGIVVRGAGDVNSLSYRDFQVNESRVFASDGGNILVWSTDGDIDAGRGAKTAISAPPPTITINESGVPIITFPPALTGSGIQTLASSPGVEPGDVDLFAPRGVVNAGDAGIVAGNLTIAATAVLGADNIQVSGVAVGVPVDTGGLGAALAGVSNVASSATSAATTSVDAGDRDSEKQTSLADTALSWLEVFVIGLGEDQCTPQDTECLKRQTANP